MDALSTIFWLLCLASYFSYVLLPYPGMFIFFVSLRLCSSHLLLSASAYFIARLLVSFVSCLISEFLCFYLFNIIISRVAFFCCALVPGTLAVDLPTLILSRLLFFLCVTVTTEFESLA